MGRMFLGIGNLDLTEIVIVIVVAIIVFGRNLPRVAARAAVQFGRARRSMQTLWRETGIEDEIRTVQAEIRDSTPSGLSPTQLAREATRRIKAEIEADPVEAGGEKPPGESGSEPTSEPSAQPNPEPSEGQENAP